MQWHLTSQERGNYDANDYNDDGDKDNDNENVYRDNVLSELSVGENRGNRREKTGKINAESTREN